MHSQHDNDIRNFKSWNISLEKAEEKAEKKNKVDKYKIGGVLRENSSSNFFISIAWYVVQTREKSNQTILFKPKENGELCILKKIPKTKPSTTRSMYNSPTETNAEPEPH